MMALATTFGRDCAMALSPEAEEMLNALADDLQAGGRMSHRSDDRDFRRAIQIFIKRYRVGEEVHSDEVKEWAVGRGWSESDAGFLGEMADIVNYTLREVSDRRFSRQK
jgi:hypothetical protein